MARRLSIISKILTDYRAIAHIVEAIILILLVILVQRSFAEIDLLHLIPVAYAIFESLKGALLLRGIIKEHSTEVKIYNIFSAITIIVKMMLYGVWVIHVQIMVPHIIIQRIDVLLCIPIGYFGYEWYLFYHITQFYYYLKSNQEEGYVKHKISEEGNVKHKISRETV